MTTGNYLVSATISKDDIDFAVSPYLKGDPVKEQEDIVFDIESTLETARNLYREKAPRVYDNYFEQLLKIGQVGVSGVKCQPGLARRALEHIKIEITNRESARTKNNYLRTLGKNALLLGLPTLFVVCIINNFYNYLNITTDNLKFITNLLLVWSGCMSGVWLSFSITRPSIGFDDLIIIEKDGLEPIIRLLFTGLLAIIFGLLFMKDAISITLGKLSSANVKDDATTAFLIGVILGLNEKIIGNTLSRRTAGLFTKSK